MKILLISILSVLLLAMVQGQSWTIESEPLRDVEGIQDFAVRKSIVAKVSDDEIHAILWSAPQERESIMIDSPARLNLMMDDGTTKYFAIVRYEMQQPALAAKFDHIRTFKGVCISDPKITARLDYTVHGLRAVINAPNNHVYIEHYKRGNKDYKIIYNRKDYIEKDPFVCGVTEAKVHHGHGDHQATTRQGNCEFNTARLANATTAEYSAYHISDPNIPDEDEVHSAVVTSINRVNEVYEQEFGVRLILVDNNELLYFYDSATDPYDNDDGGAMLSQNQTTVDDEIGNTNYDIGHVFSTGGGGVAYLSSVCNISTKAGGVTGQPSPIGDPFDIDYVSHEMGHQMGANHTQNNNCNRVSVTAMEPGSASTIMGYAGICSPNVQNNSDPYFHAISIEEIMNDATTFSCMEEDINFGNTSPSISLDATSYNIPKSTTFVLDATVTDSDGDALTYCWEQMDNEVANMPPESTNTDGPAFRSLEPVTDSQRYFPSLDDIIAGTSTDWEVLSSVARDYNFRLTVRDWHDGHASADGGCTSEADLSISVDGNSGPFVITSHTTASTWEVGSTETITWDVANTDVPPVNCNNVEIWFSEDDTFQNPALITTTANDGSASITVPSTLTTTGRYMLKGENNIFFDINEGLITIEQNDPTFVLELSPTTASLCNTSNTYNLKIKSTSILGYSTPINLSYTGLPAGASATFDNNPLTPGNITFLNISDFSGETGVYFIEVMGQSGSIMESQTFELILSAMAVAPTLTSPVDGQTDISIQPTLVWQDLGVNDYEYEVSTSANGGTVVASGTTVTNQVTVTTNLLNETTYYWRVRTVNACGISAWSSDYTFTTKAISCATYFSSDIPIVITSDQVVTVTSDINIYDRGVVNDIDVVNLQGTHTWMNDLNFSLIAPDNTKVKFWDQPCTNGIEDFDINFDDEAANGDFPCPPTDGLTYIPDNPLTSFDNKNLGGLWQLEIFDDFAEDGGTLESWGLKFCLNDYCDLTVSNASSTGPGSLNSAFQCAENGDTIRLMSDISMQTINMLDAISVDKNINIIANKTDNITVHFGVGTTGLIIESGNIVSMEGFSISSESATSTITNNGTLKVTDMDVSHVNNYQLINTASGIIEVLGDCNIKE